MHIFAPTALAFLVAGMSACSTEASSSVKDSETSETQAAVSPEPPSASVDVPTEAPREATCRTVVGPRIAREHTADVYQVVSEHTVPVRTRVLGAGCLVVLHRDFTAPMLAPGEPWPYAYAFFVTDAGGKRATALDTTVEPAEASLAAVATGNFNGDDETDIVAVHDAGPALVWLSTRPGQWGQDLPAPGVAGIDAQTVAAVRATYRDLVATPISP